MGRALRSDYSRILKRGLKSLSKTVQCAQPTQFGWDNLRVRLLPAVEPQPRQMIDVSLFGSSYLRHITFYDTPSPWRSATGRA